VDEQPRTRRLPVLVAERAQVFRVGETGPTRRLDFDGNEAVACLDHEVHLVARRRAPVVQLAAIEARIPPDEEIGQYEVLEVRAARLCYVLLKQSGRDYPLRTIVAYRGAKPSPRKFVKVLPIKRVRGYIEWFEGVLTEDDVQRTVRYFLTRHCRK
jgi:hypothetical protein